jgi:hypothetical protein
MAFEASFGESKENNRRHRKWTWMDVEHITENLQSGQRKPTRGSGRESDVANAPQHIPLCSGNEWFAPTVSPIADRLCISAS